MISRTTASLSLMSAPGNPAGGVYLLRTSTTLQGTPYVLAHYGEPLLYVRSRRARIHPASLTIEARFRPVRGFCMR